MRKSMYSYRSLFSSGNSDGLMNGNFICIGKEVEKNKATS